MTSTLALEIPLGLSFRRTEPTADSRPIAAKLSEIVSVSDWGVVADNTDHGARMQRALDECPIGCELFFPTPLDQDLLYVTAQTLNVNRHVSLVSDGGAQLIARFASNSLDLLNINHTNAYDLDSRAWRIEGFRAIGFTNANGRHVINITTAGASSAQNNFTIRGNRYIGGPAGMAGYAIVMQLTTPVVDELQHAQVENCYIENGVRLLDVTDGIKFLNCKFDGEKLGAYLDIASGAWQTTFRDCLFTNRDGAVEIVKGDFILFDNCHFEQGIHYSSDVNASAHQAQVYVNGTDAAVPNRNIRFQGCNFGGGTHCETPVKLNGHCRDIVFDMCQWRPGSSGYDLKIQAATVKATVIRSPQFANGNRTSPDAGDPLKVDDSGTATRGVWQPSTKLTFQSSWTGPNFRFMVDADGIVHFDGALVAGTTGGSDPICTLPEGYKPRHEIINSGPNDANTTPGAVVISAAGEMRVYYAGAGGASIYLTGGYRAKVRDTYETGVT